MEWLVSVGAALYVPFGHSPDVDLVADLDGRLVRVQVKTCGLCVKIAGTLRSAPVAAIEAGAGS